MEIVIFLIGFALGCIYGNLKSDEEFNVVITKTKKNTI